MDVWEIYQSFYHCGAESSIQNNLEEVIRVEPEDLEMVPADDIEVNHLIPCGMNTNVYKG